MRKLFVLVGLVLTALMAMPSPAAASGTPCNGTLDGATIPGDLVVPEDAVCTLTNSSVGDDVKVGRNAYLQVGGSEIGDDLESRGSQTLFIDTGTKIGGDVSSYRTAEAFVYNSTLQGGLDIWRATDRVQVCGNELDGRVIVHDSARDILIGDPKTVGCAANTVLNGHSLTVEDNFTDVELVIRANAFAGGDLRVFNNHGPAQKSVEDNTGGDELSCWGNEQPFSSTGNTGWGSRQGQCAGV